MCNGHIVKTIILHSSSKQKSDQSTTLASSIFSMDAFFLFYHQIKSKRNPREQRDKRKIASSVPIGWTQFTFSSQNVCWNGLPLLTQHSLIFLISIFSLSTFEFTYVFIFDTVKSPSKNFKKCHGTIQFLPQVLEMSLDFLYIYFGSSMKFQVSSGDT